MKRFYMVVVCALLAGCSHSPGGWVKGLIEPPPNREAVRGGFIPGWGGGLSAKGEPCTTVNATTKKCFVPVLQLPSGANWTTFIGEGEPHYILVTQKAEHQVVAEWRYNIRSSDQIADDFDPGMWISYHFLNKDGFRVGEFTFGSWRQCPPKVEHQRDYLIPGNLDFVADTYNVELEVLFRTRVRNC